MNPGALLIRKQRGIRSGAVIQGIGQALHEDLLYDPVSGQPLTIGYYQVRHLTHLDVPTIEVHFLEVDDGYGPFGAVSGVWHYFDPSRGRQRHLQCHRHPYDVAAHDARQTPGALR